jgi:hypothetical protein
MGHPSGVVVERAKHGVGAGAARRARIAALHEPPVSPPPRAHQPLFPPPPHPLPFPVLTPKTETAPRRLCKGSEQISANHVLDLDKMKSSNDWSQAAEMQWSFDVRRKVGEYSAMIIP